MRAVAIAFVCLVASLLMGCKSTSPRTEDVPASSAKGGGADATAAALGAGDPAAVSPSLAGAGKPDDKGMKVEMVNKAMAATGGSAKAHAAAHASAADHGVPADKAVGWLKNGNKRFMKGHVRKDGQSMKDVARLSKGQHPHTIVLSCSDSRVPPELVFDEKLGELFTIRTAGEALDDNVIASIEYAVEHLGPHLLVVMGHTSCGAVNAAIKTIGVGGGAGSPALDHLVKDIHPRIRASLAGKTPSPDAFQQSFDNAKGVAADLSTRSEIIRKAVETGKLTVTSAIYNLDSGEVIFE